MLAPHQTRRSACLRLVFLLSTFLGVEDRIVRKLSTVTSFMSRHDSLTRGVSMAFLAGPWEPRAMSQRACRALGFHGTRAWMTRLAKRAFVAFAPSEPAPRFDALVRWMRADGAIRRVVQRNGGKESLILDTLSLPLPEMKPVTGISGKCEPPPIVTRGELMDRLGMTSGELDWFADIHGRERHRPPGPLRHYRYRFIPKRAGGGRLIEAPKAQLKRMQRWILDEILDRIPPHDAAHAFRRGRSVASYVSPHAGRRIVLHIDLRNFFPSIAFARVMAMFRTVGYPEAVSRALAGLCTNSVPEDAIPAPCDTFAFDQRRRMLRLFGRPHLPQGAPTSPAIANLCAHRLDVRLSGLARKTNAQYTRYADDLVFSGDEELERLMPRFREWVCAIALDEGFTIHRRKTRVMPRGPAGGVRDHAQRASEHPAEGVRPAQGDTHELPPSRPGFAEPGCDPRLPRTSARPNRLCRDAQPGARSAAAGTVRPNPVGERNAVERLVDSDAEPRGF